jgi:hypothetical protein
VDWIYLAQAGSYDHGNEFSGYVKDGDDRLNNYWLLKKDSAA